MSLDATDLSEKALAAALPGRPARSYPALLSTEADALAWARAGAPEGAVVVADFQVSPRGRAGWPWQVRPGAGLGFSLVLRPHLSLPREGWLYTVATSGLADALGEPAAIEWPDEVRAGGRRAGAVGVQVELGEQSVTWAVVSVLVVEAAPPRTGLLARIVEAIEARARTPAARVLADYAPRCETIGRRVCARLVPMRPGGPHVTGTAVRALADGALLVQPDDGRRVAVPPRSLGMLEKP
jgi:BirA family biotin operon repressor/biotin-[acetyl-CoA-carboxylase] ligase